MIWFYYLCKKNCFLLSTWPMGIPFLQKLGQKMVIVKGFSKKFSELLDSDYSYYCQLNLLTYLIGNQQRNQSGCDLGAEFGSN